jgi:hypothetical protein
MLNRETAFIDLTKPENLKRLDIDPVLIPAFVSVMKKMQNYFSKKGLIYANNYAMMFEKLLLTDGPNKWKIQVGKLTTADGMTEVGKKLITISKERVDKKHWLLEQIICHEFIHFLVMADLPYIEQQDGSFIQDKSRLTMPHFDGGSFTNEAYTQILTNKIIPVESPYYFTLVSMMNFMNYVMDVEDNMFAFLRRQIPAFTVQSNYVIDFLQSAEKFFANNYQKDLSDIIAASKDEDYLNAMKNAVNEFYNQVTIEIEHLQFENVFDYMNRVQKYLTILPVESDEALDTLTLVNDEFVRRYFPNATRQERKTYVDDLLAAQALGSLVDQQLAEQFEISTHNCDVYVDVKKKRSIVEIIDKNGNFNCVFEIAPKKFKSHTFKFENASEPFELVTSMNGSKLELVFQNEKQTNKYELDLNEKRLGQILTNYKAQRRTKLNDLQKKMDKNNLVLSRILKQDPTITHLVRVQTKHNPPATFYVAKNIFKMYKLAILDDKQVRFSELTTQPYFEVNFSDGSKQVLNMKRYKVFDHADQPLESSIEYWARKYYVEDLKSKIAVKQVLITPTEKVYE